MKTYRITGQLAASGHQFEVPDDATEEEIAEAAAECVLQFISYGWEAVEEDT